MSTQSQHLGARQSKFIDEYMVDLNATRAAIAAGYSKKTAAQTGWENLRKPQIAGEISQRQKKLSNRLEVTAENVVNELAKLAFANIGDFYTIRDGRLEIDTNALTDPMKAAALTQVDIIDKPSGDQIIKIRLCDKRSALTDLGKHLGLFAEKTAEVAATPESEISDRDLALDVLYLFDSALRKTKEQVQ